MICLQLQEDATRKVSDLIEHGPGVDTVLLRPDRIKLTSTAEVEVEVEAKAAERRTQMRHTQAHTHKNVVSEEMER